MRALLFFALILPLKALPQGVPDTVEIHARVRLHLSLHLDNGCYSPMFQQYDTAPSYKMMAENRALIQANHELLVEMVKQMQEENSKEQKKARTWGAILVIGLTIAETIIQK
jgi:hypothetical protein